MPVRFVVVVLVFLASSIGAANAFGDPGWDQWRGPTRDGHVTDAEWPDRLNGPLQLQWKKTLGPSYSGPVVMGDLLFTTETVDQKFERVTAMNRTSGEVVWTSQWEGSMAVPFFAAANGNWIRSTPACTAEALVVLGMRDVLVCFDPKTGAERWRIDFPAKYQTPLQSFGAVCSPLIMDDAVYVQLGGGLTKINLADGEVVWRTLQGGDNMMSSGAFSSPSVATIAGVEQLLVQTRDELCGVTPDRGEVLWKEPIEAFRGMNILTPLAIGDRIFTAAHSGKSQLFEIQSTGDGMQVNEVWNQKTQGYMSSPVVIDGSIYLHLKNERLTCLAVDDGAIRWTSPPVGKYWSMIHNGNRILSLSSDGLLRLIDANPEQYQVIDEIKVAEDSWAYLAKDGDQVIIRALDSIQVYTWKP
ncbi:PQQ-binding-like beta-propeller repeat protein [Neorhodopirellula pilleata]|uniref:Outer membrane protein assembly factor BamB n=1 Tax=Neorhodopirellula pilleata TaxID=2714738 RepID=A0A5C6AAK9_9BACT|nr:PQQ-binding-like beta-propeller repeat protein [Neorhodopirellula pilleata]TWT96397.1 Outer membrane protein assembly factor BamB precursor [Neorhodopirellula pilleata]